LSLFDQDQAIRTNVLSLFKDYNRTFSLNHVNATDFCIVEMPNVTYLIFRGTSELTDIISDIDFRAEKSDLFHGEVHQGFLRQFEDALYYITEKLYKGTPVIITAHSLGSAVGTLFATYLKANGYTVQDAILFASPRVFTKQSVEYANSVLGDTVKRINHPADPICHCPPFYLFGYQHVGTPLMLPVDGSKEFGSQPSKIDEVITFGKLAAKSLKMPGINCGDAHKMASYIEGLEKML
jgi:hypothetical protein